MLKSTCLILVKSNKGKKYKWGGAYYYYFLIKNIMIFCNVGRQEDQVLKNAKHKIKL
jgi:hypothetical protein